MRNASCIEEFPSIWAALPILSILFWTSPSNTYANTSGATTDASLSSAWLASAKLPAIHHWDLLMRRTTRCEAFVLAVAMVLAGCGHVIPAELTGTGTPFDFARHQCHPSQDADAEQVEVRTLGSGGALIRWRGESLLLGASYSNPGLLRAYFWRGRANDALVESALHGVENVR